MDTEIGFGPNMNNCYKEVVKYKEIYDLHNASYQSFATMDL